MPRFALKMIFGEMAELLLPSERMIPRETEAARFRFQFPQLPAVLADVMKYAAALPKAHNSRRREAANMQSPARNNAQSTNVKRFAQALRANDNELSSQSPAAGA
jgi:hypothetical protein